jgi:type VI secretion system secreted protein Hcp
MIKKKLLAIAMVSIIAFMGFIATNTLGTETTYSDDIVMPSRAGMMGFVKFDGVDGEATDTDHDKWSEIMAFEQGMYQPSSGMSGMSRRRGDVVLEDIVVVKELDKSSPKLAEACLKGKVFPKVNIHLTATYGDGNRHTYYKYELKNVQVTSYVIGSEDVTIIYPYEEMTLNFEEIKVTYTEMDDSGAMKGNVEYEWKVEKGE